MRRIVPYLLKTFHLGFYEEERVLRKKKKKKSAKCHNSNHFSLFREDELYRLYYKANILIICYLFVLQEIP
jgi:hypothetical protein